MDGIREAAEVGRSWWEGWEDGRLGRTRSHAILQICHMTRIHAPYILLLSCTTVASMIVPKTAASVAQ